MRQIHAGALFTTAVNADGHIEHVFNSPKANALTFAHNNLMAKAMGFTYDKVTGRTVAYRLSFDAYQQLVVAKNFLSYKNWNGVQIAAVPYGKASTATARGFKFNCRTELWEIRFPDYL